MQVDYFGSDDAFAKNAEIEFQRNQERYKFLKWGQNALDGFKVVPPDTGIVHQINVEYLSRVVFPKPVDGATQAYFDTCVGTDSHTTMVNGIGVLGWGVGGIEAEASMLGQPVSMLVPKVVGFKLTGELKEGVTATDLVLTIVDMLRQHGVVGKFVEFYGPAIGSLPMGERATIANMGPEYGATCGLFPIDEETLSYLRLTGRSEEQVALVEAYAKAQGVFHTADAPEADYSETLSLDLGTVVPSLAGPKRPQDRVQLTDLATHFPKPWPHSSRSATSLTSGPPTPRSTARTWRSPTAPSWSQPSPPAPTPRTPPSCSAPAWWPKRPRRAGSLPRPGSRPRWDRAPWR